MRNRDERTLFAIRNRPVCFCRISPLRVRTAGSDRFPERRGAPGLWEIAPEKGTVTNVESGAPWIYATRIIIVRASACSIDYPCFFYLRASPCPTRPLRFFFGRVTRRISSALSGSHRARRLLRYWWRKRA